MSYISLLNSPFVLVPVPFIAASLLWWRGTRTKNEPVQIRFQYAAVIAVGFGLLLFLFLLMLLPSAL